MDQVRSLNRSWTWGFIILMLTGIVMMMVRNFQQSRVVAHEAAAIKRLQVLAASLETYRAAHGNYPEKPPWSTEKPEKQLDPGAIVDEGVLVRAYMTADQFNFQFEPRPGGYALAATPHALRSRSFYLDQSGQIRHCSVTQPGEWADASDASLSDEPKPCKPTP